jgi:hypothetical protein
MAWLRWGVATAILAAYTLAGIVASHATLGQLELTPGR